MYLGDGIEVLVKDRIDLNNEGGSGLSLQEVVDKLSTNLALAITPQMEPIALM